MPRGDVLSVNLPQPVVRGREQIGTRPAIAIQADLPGITLPTVMIIPLTSNRNALRFGFTVEILPSPQNGLAVASVAMCFQLRAIDNERVLGKLGTLEQGYLDRISQELVRMLGL